VHNHPHAHVLRRYLGGAQDPQPDFRLRLSAEESDTRSQANQGFPLQAGDRFLVCSDGLTDLVTDAEIQTILGAHPPATATQTFIDLARARGGHDNITVICVLVPPRLRRTSAAPRLVLALVSLLLLVAAGSIALWWLGLWPW